MKKLSKIFFTIALLFCVSFSLCACKEKTTKITINYLTFEKINSYTLNYDGAAGAGAVVSKSVFKINTEVHDGIMLKYEDFMFTNENGTPHNILSIEIYSQYNVYTHVLPTTILNKDSLENFKLLPNKTIFIEIKCVSGTLDGKHKLSYLSTVIDEINIIFNV